MMELGFESTPGEPTDLRCTPPSVPSEADILVVIEEFETVLGSHASSSDDFFSLGGSSLLAARVAAGLTTRCAKLLTLVDILRLRTPAAIASYLATALELPNQALPATAAEDVYELSPPQRWYSKVYKDRLQSTGVMSFVVELPDGIGPAAVWQALDAMLARHDSLRTSVQAHDGRLVQRPLADAGTAMLREPSLALVNEVSGGREDVSRAASDIRVDYEARGILLDGRPLLRAILVRGTDPAASRPADLVIVIHHLIFDGASLPVFTRELLALLENPDTALRPAASYRDYTSWRLRRESSDRVSAEQGWWRTWLAGFESSCHLPIRRERGHYAGYASSLTLPESLREALAAAAKRHMVPVSALRMAAFFALCHVLYNNDDMIIGMPVSVRDHPALRDAIGMFINFVPLRHRIKEQESVHELIQDVASELMSAAEHKESSFDLLMEQMKGRCEFGRFPITGAVINGAEMDSVAGPPWAEPTTEGLRRCNVCDIQVFFSDVPGRVDLELQHRADIYSAEDGARLLECYAGLLSLVAHSHEGSVHSLISYAEDILEL